MAKKAVEETQAIATVDPNENTDLATLGDLAPSLSRPASLDPNDLAGTEDITAADIRLPRLAIAQGLSPQLLSNKSEYIPDLKIGQLFNDLTGEIYGNGPLTFVAIRRDVRRIEFVPRNEGGGIRDMNVPAGDVRLQWSKNPENGEDMPPAATTFVEFVALLLRAGKGPEPVVISIKATNKWQTKAANQLTTFIKLRRAAIYSGLYTVSTTLESNDSGTFGVFGIKNAGWIPVETSAGKMLHTFAKEFHDSLEGKEIVVNREEASDEEFDEADTIDATVVK